MAAGRGHAGGRGARRARAHGSFETRREMVAGCAHSIVNYIPHDNFVAMINSIHKYGAY